MIYKTYVKRHRLHEITSRPTRDRRQSLHCYRFRDHRIARLNEYESQIQKNS